MNYLIKVAYIIFFSIMATACAGVSTQQATQQQSIGLDRLLPDIVPESFHYTIQNSDTKEQLSAIDREVLVSEQRLTHILLNEIAEAGSREDLGASFNRIWEKESILKEIVDGQSIPDQYDEAVALVYYILSADPESPWQINSAKKIYDSALAQGQISLSGYPLHFYTLALLQSGKISQAIPYLERLREYTSPEIYLKDLVIALSYSLVPDFEKESIQIMAMICDIATDDNKFPISEMRSAVQLMVDRGQTEQVQKVLLPILNKRQIDYYEVLREILAKNDSKIADKWYEKKGRKNDLTPYDETGKKDGVQSSINTAFLLGKSIVVEVQVIKAGQGGHYIDPELAEISQSLKDTFSFRSFKLLDTERLSLRTGEKGELLVNSNHRLEILFRSLEHDQSRLEVAILKDNKEILNTVIDSIDQGVTVIGGPHDNDGLLLLRIKTRHGVLKT